MMPCPEPGRVGWTMRLVAAACLVMPAAARAAKGDADGGLTAVRAGAAIRAAETSLGLGATAVLFRGGGSTVASPGGEVRAGRLGPAPGVAHLYTAMIYDVSGGGPGPAGGSSLVDRVEVRLGGGFDPGRTRGSGRTMLIPFIAGGYEGWSGPANADVYHAALAGGGIKLDLAVSDGLVVSASAEGLAVLGGLATPDAAGNATGFGVSGEAAVRLGANLRLDGHWRAFAGLGLRYRERPQVGGRVGAPAGLMPASTTEFRSVVGLAYGFR